MPYNMMERVNNFLSRRQTATGWSRSPLIPIPHPLNASRREGIKVPLYPPKPLASGQSTRAQIREMVDVGGLTMSEDGEAANFNVLTMMKQVLAGLQSFNLLRSCLVLAGFLRMQILFDGVSFFRGRMATRLIVRCSDVNEPLSLNDPNLSRDVSFYLGLDHHFHLWKYCSGPLAWVNSHSKTDAAGKTGIQLEVSGRQVQVTCGGDASSANSAGACEPCCSKLGCCIFCMLRRAQWFDAAKVDGAERRTFHMSRMD